MSARLVVLLGLLGPLTVQAGAPFPKVMDLPLRDVRALDVGKGLGCAVAGDIRLWCWRLRSERRQTETPFEAFPYSSPLAGGAGGRGVPLVAVGLRNVVCAVTAGGLARCWTLDRRGDYQLENQREGVAQIDGGVWGFCALTVSGAIACWRGKDKTWRSGPDLPEPAVEVSVGDAHACARLKSGHVFCWGSNRQGQLGDSGVQDSVSVPQLSDAISVSAGGTHTCAVRTSGQILCWGGPFRRSGSRPVQLQRLETGHPAAQVSTAGAYTCAVGRQGAQKECWLGNTQRVRWDEGGGVARRVVAGRDQACIQYVDGKARCWARPPPAMRRESAQAEKGSTNPASASVRLALGGGKRLAPERAVEALFDLALRFDVVWGHPSREESAWGVGPLLDMRSADLASFETGAGLLGYLKIGRYFSFLLGGGAGWACRRGDDLSEGFGFVTFSLGHRSPLDRIQKGDRLIYSPNIQLYIDGRWGLGPARTREITAGLEFEPLLLIAVPVVALGLDQ